MSFYNFPDQTIPENKKDEEWHKSHILGYVSYAGSKVVTQKKKEVAKLYYAAYAELHPDEKLIVESTITQRCGNNLGPQYVVYPLIESKIEKLVGDYRKRPIKRKLLVNNPDAVNKKFDHKIDMIAESLIRKENESMADAIGFSPESPNPDMEIPEDIDAFFTKSYRTLSEMTGEEILKQVLVVRKEKEKLYDALAHYLISSTVWGLIGEKDGHPSITIVSDLDCEYDHDPNEKIQRDPNYFMIDTFMSNNDIFNNFEVKESDKRKIQSYKPGNSDWFKNDNAYGFRSRVVSMYWKSRKRIKFKSFTNKAGNEEYKILSDDYKERNRDKIEYVDIEDIRHITMLGPDVVLSWGSLENQMQTIGNQKKRFIPAVGLVDQGLFSGKNIRSLAGKLKYLQDFASEILYEVRINMRQIDGNALVWDLANSPKEWLKDGPDAAYEKMNYYLKRDHVQIINSRDKRTNPYASSVNVSQRGRLQDLLSLLSVIENLADTICGISTKEQNPYQKATVAEIAYDNVSSRVERYFGLFDTFTDVLNERILISAKSIYKEGETYNYFAGDNNMKFLSISPDFFYDDYGIYVTDSRKDYEDKQLINDAASKLFGNAQTPELLLDLIRVIQTDNGSEAELIVEKGVEALKKIKAENDKMLQETENNKIEWEKEKQTRVEAENEKNRQSQEKIALIYSDSKTRESETKNQAENLRKMADIEKDLTIEANRNQNKKNDN